MAMTKAEIQKRSDEKRGVKVKGIKMKLEDIALKGLSSLAVMMWEEGGDFWNGSWDIEFF